MNVFILQTFIKHKNNLALICSNNHLEEAIILKIVTKIKVFKI